jgi:DNA-binding response OmpR family regulator
MFGEAALDEALVILVVEDDQTIQSIVAEALGDGGFEPAIASSGEEALTLLGGNKYRVLIVDIKLGKDRIRGWDVARRARATNRICRSSILLVPTPMNGPLKAFRTASF